MEEAGDQMCIKTEQTLLNGGCRLKFRWHEGSRDFMLFGLSTYWCDMFRYSSICLPVWRSRLVLETSVDASMRMHFSTKKKDPAKMILEQPRHVKIDKPFVYGIRRRLSLDFYIVLTALVFICACAALAAVMRQMKNNINRRRVLTTHIELVPITQTQTETCNTAQQNLSLNLESSNPIQQQRSSNLRHFSNSETKNSSSFSGCGSEIGMPPPYIEKPPPYHHFQKS